MVQTSYAAVLIATVALSAVSSTVASSFGNEQLQSRGMQRVRVTREIDDFELFARGGEGQKHRHPQNKHKAATAPDAAAVPATDASVAAPATRGGNGKKHRQKHQHNAAGGVMAADPTAEAPAPVAARSGWGALLEDGMKAGKAGKAGIKYSKKHRLAQKAIEHTPDVVDAIQQGPQIAGRDYTDEMFERDFEEFLEARSRGRTHKHTIAPALGHGLLGLAKGYLASKNQDPSQMQDLSQMQDPSQTERREFDEYDYFGRSYENMEELD